MMIAVRYLFLLCIAALNSSKASIDDAESKNLRRNSRFIIGQATENIGKASLTVLPTSLIINISNKLNEKVISLDLGRPFFGGEFTHTRSRDDIGQHLHMKFASKYQPSLKITNSKVKSSDCYTITWTGPVEDCFTMDGAYWYGGSEMRKQLWPINKVNVPQSAYVSHDTLQTMFGSVSERYFISSKGVGIWASEDQPLFASINNNGDNKICLNYNNTFPYTYANSDLKPFTYEICVDSDIKTVHKVMQEAHFSKPTGIPDENLFRKPIWSTWAQFKVNINQSIVLDFANLIISKNYSIGQLEIDDDWTPKYGDLTFNSNTFPNPSEMINKIHEKNLPVTLWVHPFLNTDSQGFTFTSNKGYLVKDPTGSKPALTKWWNGNQAGVIDFTNPAAAAWFLGELKNLQKLGVDSFKFDAGETTYLPTTPYKLFNGAGNPDSYVTAYARVAAQSDPKNRQEIRTGVQTQDLPVMVRMIDKFSTWGYNEGFKTLITSALMFGILGYPFVLPDYIGGNGYNGNIPDSELYIRWVQANALMPIMQFSYTPWFFKNSTVEQVTMDMIALHEKYTRCN